MFINHLDRDRADFGAALESMQEQLSPRCVAIAIPIGSEKDFRGVIDVLHMVAYEDAGDGSREAEPGPIPADMVDEAATWRERLVEAVVEVSDDLTAKYLDGEEITADELREALHAEVLRGELFPVACGSATKNEGTHALLDLIVEGVPAPSENFIAARSGDEDVVLSASESSTAVYAFKTVADAHVGRINFVRVFSGTLHADVQLVNGRTGTKERIGQVLEVQGKEHHPVSRARPRRHRRGAQAEGRARRRRARRAPDDRAGRAAARADRGRRGRAEGARRGREDGDGAAPPLRGGSDAARSAATSARASCS